MCGLEVGLSINYKVTCSCRWTWPGHSGVGAHRRGARVRLLGHLDGDPRQRPRRAWPGPARPGPAPCLSLSLPLSSLITLVSSRISPSGVQSEQQHTAALSTLASQRHTNISNAFSVPSTLLSSYNSNLIAQRARPLIRAFGPFLVLRRERL